MRMHQSFPTNAQLPATQAPRFPTQAQLPATSATLPSTEKAEVQQALDDSRAYLEKKAKDGAAVVLPSLAVQDLLVTLQRAQDALR